MSSLLVEVCEISEVTKHPGADRLEICQLKGWQVITGIGAFKVGDKAIYFPPESCVSKTYTEQWGITKYCSPLKNSPVEGEEYYRIRAARLRGEPSFGTVIPCPDASWEVGRDCVADYGVVKYEPPMKATHGDAAPDMPNFHKYTDGENIRNFPNIFEPGEEVVMSEKCHGSNCRVGYVCVGDEANPLKYDYVLGSHNTRRKAEVVGTIYHAAVTEQTKTLLAAISNDAKDVIIFGESLGPGCQDMHYGRKVPEFLAFDISINGEYVDYDVFATLCGIYGVPTVPVLFRGPYDPAILTHTDGPTLLCEPKDAGPFKGREGIVIKPVRERVDRRGNRIWAKSVSIDYLARKNGTEYH